MRKLKPFTQSLAVCFSVALFAAGLLSAAARADVIPLSTFTDPAPGDGYSPGPPANLFFNAGDNAPSGTATADIATVSGTNYILSFQYDTTGGYFQSITGSATDDATSALLASDLVTSTVIGSFETFQFQFEAEGASTSIAFQDNPNNYTYSEDGAIENVTITNVPEPASLSLMGAGLLGLGWLRRRKSV